MESESAPDDGAGFGRTIIAVPLHCAQCGGAVFLHLTDWPDTLLTTQWWTCPCCHRMTSGQFRGRVTGTTKRD